MNIIPFAIDEGGYRERANIQKDQFTADDCGGVDSSIGYVQVLRKNADPNNPYWEKLAALDTLTKNSVKKYLISNQTHRIISTPNDPAIRTKAREYSDKYGIDLRTTNGNLPELVKKLQNEIDKPTYIGVIDLGAKVNEEHVVPILFYFDGKPEHAECLILDVRGSDFKHKQQSTLKTCMPNPKQVYFSLKRRQADQESCRTDALLILRNALLHIKHEKRTGGFSKIVSINSEDILMQMGRLLPLLQAGKKIDLQNIGDVAELPPEWDYHAQISNKTNSSEAAPVIRDLYSKKKQKRENPRTVGEFRAKYTKTHLFNGEINYLRVDPSKLHELKALMPPVSQTGELSVKGEQDSYSIHIGVSRDINTFLLEKADSIWKRLPKALA